MTKLWDQQESATGKKGEGKKGLSSKDQALRRRLANTQFFGISAQTRVQALKRDIQQIADGEQRNISQICELLLHEGVEAYKKEGGQIHASPGRQTEAEDDKVEPSRRDWLKLSR